MGSNAKKKTTFAKLAREHKLRERRMEKQARKDARKREAEAGPAPDESGAGIDGELEPARVGDAQVGDGR